jgi:hypothetical protein
MPLSRPAVPEDVTDILLWNLANDVAANHQPDPHHRDRCANLRCVHETYPCTPVRDAQRARQAATRPRWLARGRARVAAPVAAVTQAFTGWFRPARCAPAAPVRTAPPARLPRRQPMAALYTAA